MLRWMKRSKADKVAPPVANPGPPRRDPDAALRKGLEGVDFTDDLLRPVLPPMAAPPEHAAPGDLTRFAPYGNGLYGHQAGVGAHSISGAPIHEPAGGAIYFGSQPSRANIDSLLQLLEVFAKDKAFAIFTHESASPIKDRCLTQLRIVSKFALRSLYCAIEQAEYEAFPEHDQSLGDTLWKFITDEQERWGTSYSPELAGRFGGDGDMARESLAFGFMVENSYFGVYRVWSRAWLVTK